ncbi:MAG: hypothetical protein WCO12_00745 [bacterium]
MQTKTIRHISHIQKEIFWATAATFIALVGLYVFFLASSIVNVAVRQNVNDKVVALSSKVAQLEFQYVSLQNAVTSDVATSEGYVAQAPVAYVAKDIRLSMAR